MLTTCKQILGEFFKAQSLTNVYLFIENKRHKIFNMVLHMNLDYVGCKKERKKNQQKGNTEKNNEKKIHNKKQ
jgi:hypothetical protein